MLAAAAVLAAVITAGVAAVARLAADRAARTHSSWSHPVLRIHASD